MKKKKQPIAMITGITGQLASYLAELLLEKGYYVVGLKRRTSILNTSRVDHIYNHPSFKMEYFDLSDTHSMYALLSKYKPNEIYNLAAQSHVRVSFDVPENTVDVVALGTLRLLNAFKTIVPSARFYQASSSEMFGVNPNMPLDENSKFMPASPYACAKVFGHNICVNYRESYGLHVSCGIVFNTESPRRGETFVTRKITQAAAKIKCGLQDELVLGNLDAKRDWSYAEDTVRAMWLMLQQDTPDDYVIATGETHSVKEFLEHTFITAGLGDWRQYVKIDKKYFRPQEVPCLLGDATKAREKLGWESKIKFNQLVELMYFADLEELMKEGE